MADVAEAQDGRAAAITVMTPIRPGFTPLVRLVLFTAKHVKALNVALADLSFIHMARWAVITGIPQSSPDQETEGLRYDYLFFETNFNGDWDEYIDAFSTMIPQRMQAIWGSSYGFPGPQPAARFRQYIHHNDMPIAHYYSAYPEGSTTMVLAGQSLGERLEELKAKAREAIDPVEFRRLYESFLADVRKDL